MMRMGIAALLLAGSAPAIGEANATDPATTYAEARQCAALYGALRLGAEDEEDLYAQVIFENRVSNFVALMQRMKGNTQSEALQDYQKSLDALVAEVSKLNDAAVEKMVSKRMDACDVLEKNSGQGLN